MLKAFQKSRGNKASGEALSAAIAARAREPVFFIEFGVPDTIDGRFDLVALHAWLALETLQKHGMNDISQGLIDCLFTSFDEGLRELGVGDIGIGHRMKKLAGAFYGRLSAYEAAADEAVLKDAILRNLYRGDIGCEQYAEVLARYAMATRQGIDADNLAAGRVDFGPLPKINSRR